MMFRALLIAAALTLAVAPAQAATAVLRGLDKTSGQTTDFNAPVGKSVKFHSLEITARTCSSRPVEESPPEAWVYLEITDTPVADADEQRPGRTKVFSGWMFQSSPALNALDHPTYDVWLIACKA
jgi:hypothetical protein